MKEITLLSEQKDELVNKYLNSKCNDEREKIKKEIIDIQYKIDVLMFGF